MNLSIIGGSNHMDRRLNLSNKTSTSMNTTLNPNAAEFVPSFHRSSSGTGTGVANPNAAEFIPSSLKSPTGNGNVGNPATATLDRSESSASTNSEEEAHKYWRVQLPDDITPDFRATGEDELRATETISLARLSISEGGMEPPVLSPSLGNNGNRFLWGKQFANVGKSSMNGREVNAFNGASSASPVHDFNGGSVFSTTEDSSINPIKFLSLKYPGISSQTLADIYLRSGQDLSLTLEILAEMESQKMNSKSFSSLNMTAQGSPVNGLYRSLSTTIRGGDTDLSSPVSEAAPNWRYRGDGSSLAVGPMGSGRIARNLSYNGTEDMASGGLGSPWLESTDSVGNVTIKYK
ncbi:polyadenylate-binding protein-interacting protein 7-like protein [Carex littledalei]|uniref:Polyadenylate-binding protein-interacting protein 7-like protein n=1 Tax=Carex littledalei TaxID=544730 RepID=A0A833VK94_9POAL|nr:polyadenylate-binding protein-interacting protein 7-like protein [Carex littledalei]